MKNLKLIPSVLTGMLTLASMSVSAEVLDLYGDKDCFGTGNACIEDGSTWAVASWSELSQDVSDPSWTDKLFTTTSDVSWTHTFTAGSYTDALLTFRTAGIADIRGPYAVYVDGVEVGSMPLDGYGHILAETFSFSIDAAYLLDGMLDVSFTTGSGDYWALDYAEITATVGAVPVPAAAFLFAPALLGFMGLRRKAKQA